MSAVKPAALASDEGTQLFHPLQADGFQWRQLGGGATETQSFIMSLENGDILFCQLVYNSVGLSPTFQSYARHFPSDRSQTARKYTASHSAGSKCFSADKQSIQVSELTFVRQTTTTANADGVARIRYTVQLAFPSCTIAFIFDAITPGMMLNEGVTTVNGNGHITQRYIPLGTVTELQVYSTDGRPTSGSALKGTAAFLHLSQSVMPHTVASTWHTALLMDPGNGKDRKPGALFSNQFLTPGPHKTSVVQGWWVYDGEIRALFSHGGMESLEEEKDAKSGYKIPQQVRYRLEGKSLQNEHVSIEVSADRKEPRLVADVLSDLPFLLRKVVQTFVAKPYYYAYTNTNSVAKAELGDSGFAKVEMTGVLYQESVFLTK